MTTALIIMVVLGFILVGFLCWGLANACWKSLDAASSREQRLLELVETSTRRLLTASAALGDAASERAIALGGAAAERHMAASKAPFPEFSQQIEARKQELQNQFIVGMLGDDDPEYAPETPPGDAEAPDSTPTPSEVSENIES